MSLFWSVTLFWGAAAVAVALALAFVLPFLLRNNKQEHEKAARRDINLAVYRDQMKDLKIELSNTQLSPEQFLASKLELETRAAEDALAHEDRVATPVASRRLGFVLAGVLPVAAIGLYFALGNPGVLSAVASGQSGATAAADAAPTEEDILRMVQQIEARTKANPTDSEAWEALATANAMMARWPEALQAYQKTYELLPKKPSVMSGYAEAIAMTSNLVLAGRPIELVTLALQTDPNNKKALELAGIHAYQNQDFAQSVKFLDRLQPQLPPGSRYTQEILAMRNEAQRLAQLGGGAQTAGVTSSSPPDGQAAAPPLANAANSIVGSVDVAAALQSRVGSQDTIYLIARAGEGGPPLAATRVKVGQFPLSFSLDDSMAMNPANTLSGHKQVVVLARISASGNPIAQPGDLEGRITGVAVGAKDVKLVIDRVLP
jgi:cytochrome c-type biogenesis protein CcmH